MSALQPWLRRLFSFRPSDLRDDRFFQDKLSLGIVVSIVLLNILTILVTLIRLHARDILVPVRYSTLSSFDVGPWYQNYAIGGFGLVVSIVNIILARQSFSRSRVASFYLLMGAAVTAFFCLVIANAFAMVSQL